MLWPSEPRSKEKAPRYQNIEALNHIKGVCLELIAALLAHADLLALVVDGMANASGLVAGRAYQSDVRHIDGSLLAYKTALLVGLSEIGRAHV